MSASPSAPARLGSMVRGPVWLGAYLAVVVVPLIFAAIGVVDDGRGFRREFTVALGFVGLSMMGLQFVLVAGVKAVAAPFGEDALVHFHRYMGYVGTVLADSCAAAVWLLHSFAPAHTAKHHFGSLPRRYMSECAESNRSKGDSDGSISRHGRP